MLLLKGKSEEQVIEDVCYLELIVRSQGSDVIGEAKG
jgi:hypothetical protein